MPLSRKLATVTEDEARRHRAELRTSYGNKLSNMNLSRLRSRSNPNAIVAASTVMPKTAAAAAAAAVATKAAAKALLSTTTLLGPATSSLRRIASSFAHVSDIVCNSSTGLPHEDTDEDVREELAEVLIRSEPFKLPTIKSNKSLNLIDQHLMPSVSSYTTDTYRNTLANSEDHHHHHQHSQFHCNDVSQVRANERWGQIAGTVSALFRVRRIQDANPLSELRRLREQRDLLEAFTRPFLYEDGGQQR